MKKLILTAISLVSVPAFAAPAAKQPRAEGAQVASSELEWEAAMSLSITNHKSETQYEDTTENYSTTSRSTWGVISLYRIVGSFEVGPTLRYIRYDAKTTYNDSSTSGQPYTDINWGGGVGAKYNFADIQTEKTVPFAQVGFTRMLGNATSKSHENELEAGLGLNWFMVRNVALTSTLLYTESVEYVSQGRYSKSHKRKENDLGLAWGLATFF